jgi:hypothetical protein
MMTATETLPGWYVVARDGHEADHHVDGWGPFDSEADAVAFGIDLASDNGWSNISTLYTTQKTAQDLTTKKAVNQPYK